MGHHIRCPWTSFVKIMNLAGLVNNMLTCPWVGGLELPSNDTLLHGDRITTLSSRTRLLLPVSGEPLPRVSSEPSGLSVCVGFVSADRTPTR